MSVVFVTSSGRILRGSGMLGGWYEWSLLRCIGRCNMSFYGTFLFYCEGEGGLEFFITAVYYN